MTTVRTPSQQGRANRRRGHQAERDLARWLRANGWPHAERAVRTGFRAGDRTGPDPGDIAGMVGWVVSVKDRVVERPDAWLAELHLMTGHAAALGLVVQKRRGHADPARWWCWLTLPTLVDLVALHHGTAGLVAVRMELGHVVPLLHAAGHGDPGARHTPTTGDEA